MDILGLVCHLCVYVCACVCVCVCACVRACVCVCVCVDKIHTLSGREALCTRNSRECASQAMRCAVPQWELPHSLEEGVMQLLVVNGEFPHLGTHLNTCTGKGTQVQPTFC